MAGRRRGDICVPLDTCPHGGAGIGMGREAGDDSASCVGLLK